MLKLRYAAQMLLKLLAVFFCCLAVRPAAAEPSVSELFQQIESPTLEVLKPDSVFFNEETGPRPLLDQVMSQDSLKYDPDAGQAPRTPECALRPLQEKIQAHPEFPVTSALLADYFARCEDQIKLPWINLFTNLYRTIMVRFRPLESPYGRQVIFHLPGDLKVKAFLAMKGDGRPRPLVIFRLGVFSRATLFPAETFELMHLFEGSPFNVLVLESTTGPDFLRRNSVINFAGFDEGVQNYQIAKILQTPAEPISKMVQGVHMVAISLGGQGMFYAALLDEWGQQQHRPALFRSFMGFCPLVDLHSTWQAHAQNALVAAVVGKRIDDKMQTVPEKVPGFPVATLLQDLEPYLAKNYQGSKSLNADLPLPEEVRQHANDFWWLNDFQNRFRDVRSPILIFATKEDPLVPFALNSKRLMDKSLSIGTTPFRVIPLNEGVHCTLPGAYQWKTLTLIQQFYLLSQATDFHVVKKDRELFLNWGPRGPERQDPIVEVTAAERPTQLRWKFHSAIDQRLLGQIDVPFSDIGWGSVPVMLAQKSLERWAQQNLRWSFGKVNSESNARIEWEE